MKKQFICLLALFMAVSGTFYSCGNQSGKGMGALEFDSISIERTMHLFSDTAKPACHLTLSMAYVSAGKDKELNDSINMYLISFALGEKYIGMAPQEASEKYAANYVETYRHDLEPLYLKDEENAHQHSEDIGSWYAYYQTVESRVQHYRHHLLTYRLDYTEYTGGAHGIYMSSFLNLDLRTLYPLRLGDLFVTDYEEPLTNLLWLKLMADNDVSSREALEEMGFGTTGNLTPTENFFLSPQGITFYYNVYDIAPYVMGPTEIHLSWEDVAHLLENGNPFTQTGNS